MLTAQQRDELCDLLCRDLTGAVPEQVLDDILDGTSFARGTSDLDAVAAACLPLLREDRTLAQRAYRARERWPEGEHSELIEFILCVHARGEDVAAVHGPWLPLVKDEHGAFFEVPAFGGLYEFMRAMEEHSAEAAVSVQDGGHWTYTYRHDPSGTVLPPTRVRHAWVLAMLRDGFSVQDLVQGLAEHEYRPEIVEAVLRDGIAVPLADGRL